MVDMANGQDIPLNVNIFSSWYSWHADLGNVKELQKAQCYRHGHQFLSGHRVQTTPSLECLPDLNHPLEGDEITVTALYEEELCERGRVNSWKNGPGRKKEWRSIRYLTSKRERKGAGLAISSLESASKSPTKAAGVRLLTRKTPWQIAVPRNMLMQKSTSYHGHPSSPKPRSSMQVVRNLGFRLKYTHKAQNWSKSDHLPQRFPVLFGSGVGSNLEDELVDNRGPPR